MLRGWAAALLLGLGLTGAATAAPPDRDKAVQENPAARSREHPAANSSGVALFTSGFTTIEETFLDPVDMRRLTLDGLRGLQSLDPSLRFEVDGPSLQLVSGAAALGQFTLPPNNDPRAWALVTTRIIERLRASASPLGAIDREDIYQAVFTGITGDLDPYSRYTSPKQATEERSMREGYAGVGLTLEHVGRQHRIAEMVTGGPAQRAGLHVGDLLLAIDGESTVPLTPDEISDRLRGQSDTVVQLSIGPSLHQARQVTLHRAWIVPDTVSSEVIGKVGLIRISRFNASTADGVRTAVARLQARLGRDVHGYILDLRGNPGGKLDQATAVADLFLRDGRIISTRGRHRGSLQEFDAHSDEILDDKPLVALIDGRSASAAEIVAAALLDSGRAVLVGASTFGKGSVQTVTTLPNGGELFLTWSRMYAPSGYTLHRQGVQPTVCTSNGLRSVDEAMASLRANPTVPASTLALWRMQAPENETALAALRQTCPWKEHAPTLDVDIARALLDDPPLYNRALARSRTNMAER
ncbi:S41 family peptidase [Oleisolibacter albus]|uniref:S41 family peptidase n=1 Tax=Oleisolibacter albus TaxID=2171757 RepID=UPI000DF4650D|nr:S41 family peptidase [Oleisolibacter albus]